MAHLFQQPTAQGLQLSCSICRVGFLPRSQAEHVAFLQAHQHAVAPADPRYYGAGDLVAGVAGALGIAQCAPCQARQARMNHALPRLWRR